MLRSMFLLWIFMVLFGYGREANRMLQIVLGIAVFGWAARIILSFGFSMLPIILFVLLLSNVVVPFVRGFVSRFR